MNSIIQNIRHALRQMRKSPGFTAIVVITLALGIGANTAVFSIVNALLVKTLPYSHPERMGTIYTRVSGSESWEGRHHLDGEQWELLRDNVPALTSAISGIRVSGVNLQAGPQVRYVHAGRVSEHYFDVLAIQPLIGRNFSRDEDLPHGPKAAILSFNLWRNTFNSKLDIVGQAVLLKGEPYTVIGVLSPGAVTPLNADLYTAIQASRDGEGSGTNFVCVARLREGATWQQADAEINRAWSHRNNRYEISGSPGAQLSYYLQPLQKGESDPLRAEVLTLMLAAGLILLIACANLAGLTLVRVLRRTSEIATRLALGASHWQIQKQLWVENLALALLGGAVGVAFGFAALRGLLLMLPEHFLPVADVSLDNHVLAVAFVAAVLTSVLFGVLPALASRKFDLRSAIANRGTARRDPLRIRQALITGEVALTVVLLAASGLLVRSLIHLQTLPPGFDPTGVIAAKASLDNLRYHDAAAFRTLLAESTSAMRQIPGVQYAAVGLSLPYERALNAGGIAVGDGKQGQNADEVYVTPEYFAALRIPILAGRLFTDSDGSDTQNVAIVNRSFAREFFHGLDPIGRYLSHIGLKNGGTIIVGVVEDVAVAPGLDRTAPLAGEQTIYIPAAQFDSKVLALVHTWFQPSWIVRTSALPSGGVAAQMQHALASVDPNLPFSGFYRMEDLLAQTLVMQRVEVALLGTMAGLALLLSAVGIFALVANTVAQRTKEIGIRMALGSTIREAMLSIGTPGLRASGLGLAAGLALCAVALRGMRSVLYGVGAYDPKTILMAIVTLASVALFAAILPAFRVARIDPTQTLREE